MIFSFIWTALASYIFRLIYFSWPVFSSEISINHPLIVHCYTASCFYHISCPKEVKNYCIYGQIDVLQYFKTLQIIFVAPCKRNSNSFIKGQNKMKMNVSFLCLYNVVLYLIFNLSEKLKEQYLCNLFH